MQFSEEDFNDILDMLQQAEKFRPLVNNILDVVEGYGPEVSRLLDDVVDYSIKRNTKTFKMYQKRGFSREEAMHFILNSHVALANSLKNATQREKIMTGKDIDNQIKEEERQERIVFVTDLMRKKKAYIEELNNEIDELINASEELEEEYAEFENMDVNEIFDKYAFACDGNNCFTVTFDGNTVTFGEN